MTDDIVEVTLDPVQQNLFAESLPIDSSGFQNQPRFETMLHLPALIICHKPRHRQRILGLVKIYNLSIGMGLKGCKRGEEINGFEHAGFALRIAPHKQSSPPWKFYIQAGKTAKVGEGEVF